MKFEVFLLNKKWHWLLVSSQGAESHSSRGFWTQEECIANIETFKTTVCVTTPIEVLDVNGPKASIKKGDLS